MTTNSSTHLTYFNGTVYDEVFLTVPAGQPIPTGNVTFYLCDPNNVTSTGCPSGGFYVSENTLVNGYTKSNNVTIGQDVPAIKGWWCWRAVYSGDNNYEPIVHTNRNTECFYVNPDHKVPVLSMAGLIALAIGIVAIAVIMRRI